MKIVDWFSSFSVRDIETVMPFYSNTLGLKANIDKDMGIIKIELSGTNSVMIYPKGDSHKPATFTVLNLFVQDLESSVDELSDKGVKFEHYDNEYMKTDKKGIAHSNDSNSGADIAWFKDPDGNILSLIQADK